MNELQHVLILNAGSSSLKYELFMVKGENNANHASDGVLQSLAKGLIDPLPAESQMQQRYEKALNKALNDLKANGSLADFSMLKAIGHRVVHGGEKYTKATVITPDVEKDIEDLCVLAPLHNPANLACIRACAVIMPQVTQVAVFDTAFHQTLPEHAYLYALPYELYEKYRVRRYGFHGTSHKYVSRRTIKLLGSSQGGSRHGSLGGSLDSPFDSSLGASRDGTTEGSPGSLLRGPLKGSHDSLLDNSHDSPPVNPLDGPPESRIVVCHLGNGSSITAIKNGKSIDTSMGFTPLEGVPMGTRSGDLDPALVYWLMKNLKLDIKQIEELLVKKSGLLGLSGLSSDMRELHAVDTSHRGAQRAIEILAYRIAKYIAAYTVSLGGLDAISFTGGMGEKAFYLRAKICEQLQHLGIEFDLQKNEDNETLISSPSSKVKVFVIPTDEQKQIGEEVLAVLSDE